MRIKRTITILLASILLVSLFAACKVTGESSKTDLSSSTSGVTLTSEEEETYTVSYEGGDGGVGVVPSKKGIEAGEKITLADNAFKKEGWEFAGWSDGENTYQAGDPFTVKADVTFTALWNNACPEKRWITDCNVIDGGWEAFLDGNNNALTLGTTDPREGDAYYEIVVPAGVGAAILRNETGIKLNIKPYTEKGSVHISVYVSDASKIAGGQIEFTSSGSADTNEIGYGEFGTTMKLQNGWNDFDIPFSSFVVTGGDPDYENINYIRVYFLTTGEVNIGVDDFYLLKGEEAAE